MKALCGSGFAVVTLLTSHAMAQGIYTCTDAKGRKITSDRPIVDCIDRTQQELSPQGTVKRVLGPTLTAQERAAQEEKEKAALELRLQAQEEKRRDRAVLARFPNQAAHDKEREQVLTQIDEVIKTAAKRTVELAGQRVAINADYEFYKKDPSKAPLALKRRLEENDSNILVQQRFVAEQDAVKRRINQRFDEELVKLRALWAMANAPVVSSSKP
jgi:Domain of unknown function (DUF4124)